MTPSPDQDRGGPLDGLKVVRVGASRAASLLCALLEGQGADIAVVDTGVAAGQGSRATGRRGVDHRFGRLDWLDRFGQVDVVVDACPVTGRPVTGRGAAGPSGDARTGPVDPRVVYCTLPSFSSLDPEWRDVRASEELLAAMTGSYFGDGEEAVELSSLPISACFAGFAGALGVAAALVARQRDGTGQLVEVPELDATLLALGAKALLANGRLAADRPSDPWAGPMRCADGRHVWINLATTKAIRRFAREVGRLETWEQAGVLGAADLSVTSPGRAELRGELAAIFGARDAAYWEALGIRCDLPITAVRALADATPAQPSGSGVTGTLGEELAEGLSDERVVEVCTRASAAPGGPAARSPGTEGGVQAPWFGRRERHGAWGASSAGEDDAPLAGVRVLDVSQMLAGPLAGRLLADLGANVIKLNNPHEDGAGFRWQENRYHTDVNRGKATVLIDLTAEEGRALCAQLIEGSDVVLENMRARAAARLGVDERRVRAIAPQICHAHVAAFSLGSRADAPGYEPNAQAIAGLTVPDPLTGVPRLQRFPVNDYGTGLLCAYGIVCALYRSGREAVGTHVGASLSRTAFVYARTLQAARSENGHEGSARGRLVRAADGWLVVDSAAVAERARSSQMSVRDILDQCRAERVAASALDTPQRLASRADLEARGVIVRHRYGDEYMVTAVGNPVRLARTPARRDRWVARPGRDGPAVLGALGWGDGAQSRLVKEGVVAFG